MNQSIIFNIFKKLLKFSKIKLSNQLRQILKLESDDIISEINFDFDAFNKQSLNIETEINELPVKLKNLKEKSNVINLTSLLF